jgi:hypothetical protein
MDADVAYLRVTLFTRISSDARLKSERVAVGKIYALRAKRMALQDITMNIHSLGLARLVLRVPP